MSYISIRIFHTGGITQTRVIDIKIICVDCIPNHVHLLIWPKDTKYDIARIDSGIKGVFSKRYRKYLLENDQKKHDQG